MYPFSKRISPESHILKSDRYWGYHPWYFSQRSFPTERKERRKEGGRRMEGEKKKEKPTSSKKKQNIWDLKTLQSISKVGQISQSWWIKFPWLPTLRASLQGEEPSATPHSPPLHTPTPPPAHAHPHTRFLNKYKHKLYQRTPSKTQLLPELINSRVNQSDQVP